MQRKQNPNPFFVLNLKRKDLFSACSALLSVSPLKVFQGTFVLCVSNYIFSKMPAAPMPPPIHMETMP